MGCLVAPPKMQTWNPGFATIGLGMGAKTLPQELSHSLKQKTPTKNDTPAKFNIATEKGWLEDEFPFGSKPIFRGYVKFQGCRPWTMYISPPRNAVISS